MLSAVSTSSPPIVATRSSCAKSPVLAGTVDGDERAEAAAQVLELVVDVIGGDLDGVDLELQAVVVGQVELGAHVDLDRDSRSPEKSLTLGHSMMSASGRPSGRSFSSSTAWR